MGRNKIKIERKADSQQQWAIYNNRKNGIAKKTKELAMLCDVDVLLLSISPKGKIHLVLGPNSNLEDMIHRYAKAGPEERHEGRLETIEVIKNGFKGDPDHEVDVRQLMNHGVPGNSQEAIELCVFRNIDNLPMITSVVELSEMQLVLKKLINLNRQKKMSMVEERARAFQQVAMNPPVAALKSDGNCVIVCNPPVAASPEKESIYPVFQVDDLIDWDNVAIDNDHFIDWDTDAVPKSDGNCVIVSNPPVAASPEKESISPVFQVDDLIDWDNVARGFGKSDGSAEISSKLCQIDPPMAAPKSDGNCVIVCNPLVAASPEKESISPVFLADGLIDWDNVESISPVCQNDPPMAAPKSDGNCVTVSNPPVAASPEKESISPVFQVDDLIYWDDDLFIDWD